VNCAHEHVGAALEEQVADLHKSLDFGVVLQVILPQLEPLNERVERHIEDELVQHRGQVGVELGIQRWLLFIICSLPVDRVE
jgi:hypothetical protein